jgi:hypothetical protein
VRDEAAGAGAPPLPFLGFAIASVGGPLALAWIYLRGAAPSFSWSVAAGVALAAAPLLVWLRFGDDIASGGGLAAFVEAAAGRRVALAQAAVWSFSYFLYLPYTVIDVAYEQLPGVFPGLQPWRGVLLVALPVATVPFVLFGLRPVLWVLAVSALVQLVLMAVLATDVLAHHGAAAHAPHARGSANVALLFVCGSLPLFLGGETTRTTVRRSLAIAWLAVGALLVPIGFALAAAPAYAPVRALAIAFGLGAAISVYGVVVAEYVALSRLLSWATDVPVRRALLAIGVPFVGLDALALTNPDGFDERLLRPSLVALFLSQLAVFAVYPVYRRRHGKLGATDVAIAAIALALMGWGLYRALAHPLAT